MHPGEWAEKTPDKPAVIMHESGVVVTYRELEDRSRRLAQLWWSKGLRPGDHVALFMENRAEFYDVAWAAMRSGLYLTTVNRYLTSEEAGYIIDDCEAQSVVVSATLARALPDLQSHAPRCHGWLVVGGDVDGYDSYETSTAAMPAEPLADEPAGAFMLYSSGTTGRPKGIKAPLPGKPLREHSVGVSGLLAGVFGFDESHTYLSPAPLYHSAPAGFSVSAQALGGTVVVLEHFDPVGALQAIERHHVTHSQWVPTMFVRMLKLPEEDRTGFDLSSHRVAIHAAAPCPREVKRQMLEWWGPVVHEYYAGTEGIGFTYVGPEDWLAHPGTVGRSILGTIHICNEDGNELPVGEDGIVYFEQPRIAFEYHNAPEKTRSVKHPQHDNWAALGDVGHVDADGYLYLTDRATFMIVAGGVNIYPQEIEDVFVLHPKVADVAVVGVPNADLGEEVKAVVQLADGVEASDATTEELLAFARQHLARFKVPRSIDYLDELPRLPTGKLYKRLLKDRYWGNADSRIV
jgi:fatty-acyl-CoA synthase